MTALKINAQVGKLHGEPQLKTSKNGKPFATFTLNFCENKKNQAGQWEQVSKNFIDATVFGDAALPMQNFHNKDKIEVDGKIVQDEWTDKNTGQKRSKHVLKVFAVRAPAPYQGRQGGGFQGQQGGYQPQPQQPTSPWNNQSQPPF